MNEWEISMVERSNWLFITVDIKEGKRGRRIKGFHKRRI